MGSADRQSHQAAAEDTGPSPTDERVRAFDENAARFDERISRFDGESSRRDDEFSRLLGGTMGAAFQDLEPTAQVETICTETVCVFHVTSERSVGSLLGRLSPWLLAHPEGATGNPVEEDDERGLRIVLERSDAEELRPK
jgi:hypothetical protein